MTRAFIGFGSNLGDRMINLSAALSGLQEQSLTVVAKSSIYETDPVGVTDQPMFLNAAVQIETSLEAAEVIKLLKQIEVSVGRQSRERWGPREIDLDLLLWDDAEVHEEGLDVPHPELTNRAFAMLPLLEIDPSLELPSGEPLDAFLEREPAGVKLKSGDWSSR